MEYINRYLNNKQDQINNLLINATLNNIDISIKETSIRLNESIYILKDKLSNNYKCNNLYINTLEILNTKYNIIIFFYIKINNNIINCTVEIKVKNYHTLCMYSNSSDYLIKKYNVTDLTDDILIDNINKINDKINNNYIFCNCVL